MTPNPRAVVPRPRPARRTGHEATPSRALRRLLAVTALLLLLAGCAREAPVNLSGEWRGAYTCDHGFAGLTLTFGAMIGDHLPATLGFYPLPGSSDVPSGSFWMGGTFDGRERLVFTAGGWIEQPPGYELFDLDGAMSPDGRTYSGGVIGGSGCTSFFASKVQ